MDRLPDCWERDTGLDRGKCRWHTWSSAPWTKASTRFRVNYLSANGAIKLYFPDFVAVQRTSDGEVNWIVETKGREHDNVAHKDASIQEWCEKITTHTGRAWRYLKVPQQIFDASNARSLVALVVELSGGQADLFD